MAVLTNDVEAIKARLEQGPIIGYTEDLANEIGVDIQRVSVALSYIRHNCTTLGWTVPYVSPGPGSKVFQVIEAPSVGVFDKVHREAIYDGENYNQRHFVTRMRGAGEELELMVQNTDRRTMVGKRAKALSASMQAMLAAIDAMDFQAQIEADAAATV